jgi:predicted dehydrogenase
MPRIPTPLTWKRHNLAPPVRLGHTLLVQDFVASIREGRAPLVDGVEGRRSLELVLAI